MADSIEWCRRETRKHARSFYFCSSALPREKRDGAFAVYAFCRYADDTIDRAPCGTTPNLAEAIEILDMAAAGKSGPEPFSSALAWAFGRFHLDRQPFLDLIEGVRRDKARVRIENWPELRDYCYHVASVVGIIMSGILELQDPSALEHAVNMGIAMQLTNILRDIGEDYAMDRVYLPATELAEYCITETDLATRNISGDFVRLLRFQVARAREYYRSAETGIAKLPDDGSQFTVWLMRHVYAGILDEIENARYRVLDRRCATSFPRKLALAFRAWRDYRRHRR